MIRIEKLIPLFLIIIFLNNCGYTPRYGLNKNINFSINLLQLDGDREFNNSFKSKITRYKKKDANQNEFNLDITSKYNKNVKSESIDPKKIVFEEKFTMKKFEDSFEEKNYEKIVKENFSDIILDRIILYLFKLQ
jgi:uncharacterized protein (UPF0305 family)